MAQPIPKRSATSTETSSPDPLSGSIPSDGAAASTPTAPGLTETLGLHGWSALDPVLLAALAGEMPVLLVGSHGTGKSLLVERVARALDLSFRHYNASLLNYDDLVGIPLPDESGGSLRFVSTPGAIWEAEFVFLDEISRCRADLQNKLFPIIYERRVAGIDLARLRHRWAAMNPPSGDDPDAAGRGDVYYGSEPLDPALSDRFPFVVRVPHWRELSRQERQRLVAGNLYPGREGAGGAGRTDGLAKSDLLELMQACAALIPQLEAGLQERLADYVVLLLQHLEAAGLPQSPRRARTLFRIVVAVHAARLVLERTGQPVEIEASAALAVRHGLPQTASELPPSPAAVLAAHRQAWEVSSLARDSAWRAVLEEPDPVRRVLLGETLSLCDSDLSRLVTQALGAADTDARRVGLATALFLRFQESRDLTPAAWEPLAQLARRVLEPRHMAEYIEQGPRLHRWREITAWVASRLPEKDGAADAVRDPAARALAELERNYLYGGFPDLWDGCDWREAVCQFRRDLALFGFPVEEVP